VLEKWAGDITLTLAGHDDPIPDLPVRLAEIRKAHATRLKLILQFLARAHTIAEISGELFGQVHGYHVLLAIEEAGAHVEYLHQRGLLRVVNLEELESSDCPVVTRYQSIKDAVATKDRPLKITS
jgi:hypothetical protein